MISKKLSLLAATVFVLLFSFCTRAQVSSESKQAAPDKKMPSTFKFYSLADSSAFTSASFEKNKKSLVIFFDATCEHCQAEMTAIGKRYAEFAGIHFYLITMDERDQVNKFMSTFGKDLKNKKNVTVLLDPDKQFLPNFMPQRFPAIYVYSEKMELSWHEDGQREVDDLLKALK